MTTAFSKRLVKMLLLSLIGLALMASAPAQARAQIKPASAPSDPKQPLYAIDRVELETEPSAECTPPKDAAKKRDLPLAGLGDRISLYFKNCAFPKGVHPQDEWILFLDGVAVSGCHPENSDFEDGKVTFALRRNENSVEAWKTLLRGWIFYRPVGVALGTADKGIESSIAKLPRGFRLVVVPKNWKMVVSIVLAFCVVFAIVALGVKTNLLKDSSAQADTAPYSLGKVQWAWWMILILYAYLAIGLVTWDYYNIFSATALWLLGISTGTALGSIVIGSTQVSVAESEREKLKQEEAALGTGAGQQGGQAAPAAQRLQQVTNRIVELDKSLARRSKNFLQDIVSDEHGVSLHRFQAVVWTIVLGFVFFIGVWNDKSMPDFSATLLALMGISGGSYLAFKVREEQK